MGNGRLTDGPSARLEQVDLRTAWSGEAEGFTPWLAQSENLDLLGQTLSLPLDIEAVEKQLGSFRADIVCREGGKDGAYALIENQLEQTDHNHLGKLLTYAASLEAVTVIWIAAKFREEHRAVLDWLNRITPNEHRFFGVEIELWRIGDSPEAPKFNVVATPNDWSRSVASTVSDKRRSEGQLSQLEYFAGLHNTLNAQKGRVLGNKKPQPQGWMEYPIGRVGFALVASTNSQDRVIQAGLYIRGEEAAEQLRRLADQREKIERDFGDRLEWGDQSTKARDRRITYYLRDADPGDESDWQRQHEWLAMHLNKLYKVFVERVRLL